MFDRTSTGASSDCAEWLGIARYYLSDHSMGVFYIKPNSRDEILLNEEKMLALKSEQEAMLDVFFDLNIAVLKELAQALVERMELNSEELRPYLDRVCFPQDFPSEIV